MNSKADWIRNRRKQLKISQEELAARLQIEGIDITAGAISHWENGRHKPPLDDPEFRVALSVALRMSAREMLLAGGYEVEKHSLSEEAERAAYIVERLTDENRSLALDILEQLLTRNVS